MGRQLYRRNGRQLQRQDYQIAQNISIFPNITTTAPPPAPHGNSSVSQRRPQPPRSLLQPASHDEVSTDAGTAEWYRPVGLQIASHDEVSADAGTAERYRPVGLQIASHDEVSADADTVQRYRPGGFHNASHDEAPIGTDSDFQRNRPRRLQYASHDEVSTDADTAERCRPVGLQIASHDEVSADAVIVQRCRPVGLQIASHDEVSEDADTIQRYRPGGFQNASHDEVPIGADTVSQRHRPERSYPNATSKHRTTSQPSTPKRSASQLRNNARIESRIAADASLLSKFPLPNDLSDIFGPPLHSPDDELFTSPAWLLQAIEAVAHKTTKTPSAPPFRFKTDTTSVKHNTALIEDYNFDFTKLIEDHQHTSLSYSSEFRDIDDLTAIYHDHDLFPFFKGLHQNGMEYIYNKELTDCERMAELEANISRGNHRSATERPTELRTKLDREVEYGFSVPVLASCITKIPGAMVQACGLVVQYALSKTGEKRLKSRLTHDLSFCITDPYASVNKRCNMDAYPAMVYGWCLMRIIHFIVALRIRFPKESILISKYDFSDAYRRVAHKATSAVQTILIYANLAYISLRLSFGGAANPPAWCGFSEMVCDLSNELTMMEEWDPDVLFSPTQPTIPKPIYLDKSIPFAQGREMAVEVHTTSFGRGDAFIDDIIKVFLARPDVIKKNAASAPLALHVSMRPLAADEPIPRKESLSIPKLVAEGTPSEIMIVLGWEINTRLLLLCLPLDKYKKWIREINDILNKSSTTRVTLESIIGKLVHASFVIPLSQHFLQRMRFKLKIMKDKKFKSTRTLQLGREEIKDFKLWKKLLSQARTGISLNGLVFRNPTRLCFSDSCPQGLGGYTHGGRGWRLKLNPKLAAYGEDISNNLLEFLGMAITIWLSLIECEEMGLTDELILALGDNTSAVAWIFKANLRPPSLYSKAVNFIARKIATLMTTSKNFISSQHIPGMLNLIADWLSFEGTSRIENGSSKQNPIAYDCPPNDVATHRILSSFPQLVPLGFRVCHLPIEIHSFACQAMQIFESSLTAKQKGETRFTTESGGDGNVTAKTSWSGKTLALMEFPQRRRTLSYAPSLKFTGNPLLLSKERLLESVANQWEENTSKKSSALWARRCGTVTNGVPFTETTVETADSHPTSEIN